MGDDASTLNPDIGSAAPAPIPGKADPILCHSSPNSYPPRAPYEDGVRIPAVPRMAVVVERPREDDLRRAPLGRAVITGGFGGSSDGTRLGDEARDILRGREEFS